MNGAVHSPAAQHAGIGRIDDGVNPERGDVAEKNGNSVGHI
jgi:hypothetical protein